MTVGVVRENEENDEENGGNGLIIQTPSHDNPFTWSYSFLPPSIHR